MCLFYFFVVYTLSQCITNWYQNMRMILVSLVKCGAVMTYKSRTCNNGDDWELKLKWNSWCKIKKIDYVKIFERKKQVILKMKIAEIDDLNSSSSSIEMWWLKAPNNLRYTMVNEFWVKVEIIRIMTQNSSKIWRDLFLTWVG